MSWQNQFYTSYIHHSLNYLFIVGSFGRIKEKQMSFLLFLCNTQKEEKESNRTWIVDDAYWAPFICLNRLLRILTYLYHFPFYFCPLCTRTPHRSIELKQERKDSISEEHPTDRCLACRLRLGKSSRFTLLKRTDRCMNINQRSLVAEKSV